MLTQFPHWNTVQGPYLPRLGTSRLDYSPGTSFEVSQQWIDYGRSGAQPLQPDYSQITGSHLPVYEHWGGEGDSDIYRRSSDVSENRHVPTTEFSYMQHPQVSHLSKGTSSLYKTSYIWIIGGAVAVYFLMKQK